MRHIATEDKHTLVLNEDEWYVLEHILIGYNEAYAGLEFDSEDEQQITEQLFEIFDLDCLLDDYNGEEY